MEYIWRSLPKALEDGNDLEARGELLLAANLAIGVEALRHFGHAIGQPIGGLFHLSHGHTCALALPPTIDMIADCEEVRREMKIIASKMEMDAASSAIGHEIADAVRKRNKEFGIKSLKIWGCHLSRLKEQFR